MHPDSGRLFACRFRRISLEGTVDSDASQEQLDSLAAQVERRCIVASTCRASGMDMKLSLKKGAVEHDCQPACDLHDLERAGSATGERETAWCQPEQLGILWSCWRVTSAANGGSL